MQCEQLTAFIGANGSGKSSFLKSLDLFYQSNAKYTDDDFYNKDTNNDIVITVTFTNLSDKENELFQKYIEGGELTVEKVIKWPSGKGAQKYYGTSLQNPDFDPFRSASGVQLRIEYNKLCENDYPDLPAYTNKDAGEDALQKWEGSHSEKCERRRDNGQFFGFKEVGEAHLERYTRFIPVPAVRDASEDAVEGRNSPLTQIMDLVVRSVLSQKTEIVELQEGTQTQYEKIFDPNNLEELKTLESDLTDTLKTYVPDAGVNLTWLTEDAITIPMPKADIKLLEDEYPSSVDRTGHGLQRAFILTMLQHLAVSQRVIQEDTNGESGDPAKKSLTKVPNVIIGIEEPEIYQHPNRQRHFSKILLELAAGGMKGVAESTQIIYATHSPLFIDLKRFECIRALKKVKVEPDMPKKTNVIFTTLDAVAKILEKADGKPEGTFSGSTLKPRLQTLMTPWMNEGFFSNLAVLVEGEEDRAALLGMADLMEYDFDSLGISLIPCLGKNNLDRPTAIFQKFGIKVYAVWDSDYMKRDAKPEDNHRLLRLFNQEIEDWPEMVAKNFACFKKNMGDTLRNEIGEEFYDECLDECCDLLCLGRRTWAKKNPQAIRTILAKALEEGKSSETLEKIIKNIISLRQS
jgi:hypothetical protein